MVKWPTHNLSLKFQTQDCIKFDTSLFDLYSNIYDAFAQDIQNMISCNLYYDKQKYQTDSVITLSSIHPATYIYVKFL